MVIVIVVALNGLARHDSTESKIIKTMRLYGYHFYRLL